MPSPTVAPAKDNRARRGAIIISLIFGALGIVWDVLAAAVLFHSYSFFESVVVCLLVMTLCAAATVRADFEVWSGIFEDSDGAKSKEDDLLRQLRAHIKVAFYAIAFLMAVVKLVMTLLS